MIQPLYRTLFSILLFSGTLVHPNLTQELETKPAQTTAPNFQLQATLAFEKKNINTHPELKDAFIQFAATNLATQDQAMVDSIVHLMQKYPDVVQKFLGLHKEGKDINPVISQLLFEQDKENNKTTMQKIAGVITLKNIVMFGVLPLVNVQGKLQWCLVDATGKELWQKNNREILNDNGNISMSLEINDDEPDYEHENSSMRLKDFSIGIRPMNQWPSAWIGALLTAKIQYEINKRATETWGWKFEHPEYKVDSWNVERYSSMVLKQIIDWQLGNIVAGKIVHPLLGIIGLIPAPVLESGEVDGSLNARFAALETMKSLSSRGIID